MNDSTRYSDQRYYHAVILAPTRPGDDLPLWDALTDIHQGRLSDRREALGSVEHRTIWSAKSYGGEPTERQARASTGEFIYDVMAIRQSSSSGRFVTLAVPYSELGTKLIHQLRENGALLHADFIRPDLQVMASAIECEDEKAQGLNIARIDVGLSGFPAVSGFSIAGDQILGTQLYRTVVAEVTKEENAGLELKRCVVKVLSGAGTHMSVW